MIDSGDALFPPARPAGIMLLPSDPAHPPLILCALHFCVHSLCMCGRGPLGPLRHNSAVPITIMTQTFLCTLARCIGADSR